MSENHFTQHHFDLLTKWAGTKSDQDNPEHQECSNSLKEAYAVVQTWANKVQEELFPDGYVKCRKSPVNQAGNYSHYLWAKIYPHAEASKLLAYTVHISTDDIMVKMDTINAPPHLRTQYEQLRGDDINSPIVQILSIADGLTFSFEKLVQWTINSIKQFDLSYDEVAQSLGVIGANSNNEVIESTLNLNIENTNALNQILFGPPGTGKTYHTIEAAVKAAEPNFTWETREELQTKYQKLVDEKRIRFVTFHQSYGYEEFVEGLKANSKEGDISYNVEAGVFREICQQAESSTPKQNHVLIIDEINRGNISKIFGELITLIEPSKRKDEDEALELTLPYSGESFSVPNNLHIIGTMNTADRSLAMMDTALRRRFDFVEMMPKPDLLGTIKVDDQTELNLKLLLETLNKRIEILYDREHTLGHAFFINVTTLEELKIVFKNKVIPLLEEYFFEDWSKIRLVLADNQKEQKLQFITEEVQSSQQLKNLFGSNHKLAEYGQLVVNYRLVDDTSDVWSNPESYIAIYTLKSDFVI